MILSIFSHDFWPFIYLLWKNISFSPFSISLIDIKFAYIKTTHLRCTTQWYLLYSQCYSIIYIQNIFIIQKENSVFQLIPLPYFSSPWQTLICFLFLWIYLFYIYCINRIIQYMTFFILLLSLGIMFLRFIHIVACINTLFLWLKNWAGFCTHR